MTTDCTAYKKTTVRLSLSLAPLVASLLTTFSHAQTGKKKIPEPENIVLSTADGVKLSCRYFPGTNGKETVPVIILHGWDRDSNDCARMARGLQKTYGHAVVTPDLRGHGASDTRVIPRRAQVEPVRRDRFRRDDIGKMYAIDVETVKKFLLEKNNDEKLNIELLCVVGVEMGSIVAANWVAQDWSWPRLPTLKQGQDAKGIVLISPQPSFKGIRLHPAFTKSHPDVRSKVSTLVLYAKGDSTHARAAEQVHRVLKRFHAPLSDDREENIKNQDLFLVSVRSDQEGASLIREPVVTKIVAQFIDRRLVRHHERYPWSERRNPLRN